MPHPLPLALLLAVLALPAWAQPATEQRASPAQQAQQQRMRDCNAEAGNRNLNGTARRDFMSECLAGRVTLGTAAAPPAPATPATPPPTQTQQERMRSCNVDAQQRNLEGEARRSFMSQCLSTRPDSQTTAQSWRTEAEAKAGCGTDTVVWGNADSRIFHLAGTRFYGSTQGGAYLCRAQAELAGYRAAR